MRPHRRPLYEPLASWARVVSDQRLPTWGCDPFGVHYLKERRKDENVHDFHQPTTPRPAPATGLHSLSASKTNEDYTSLLGN